MLRETSSGLAVVEDGFRRETVDPGFAPTIGSQSFASRVLDVTDDRQRRLATEGSVEWQKEAWTYFDEVEEVKFAATFRGALMSRLLLFVGYILDRDQPPVPIADVPDGVLPRGMADVAQEELDRLGTLDQQAALYAQWGSISTVSGESYLIGQEDPMAETGERWRLFSESNIVRDSSGRGIAVRTRPNGPPEQIGPDAAKVRVWRPHARWPDLADSNMRSVLATAEELLIFARQFRAVGKGRNSAGILYIANEIGDQPGPERKPTKLELRFMESQTRAITEDGAPAAAVPFLVRGPAAFGTGQRQIPAKDAIFKVELDRRIDEKAVERIDFLVKRLAHGLDVPVEVLTGIADINHWGAWQIEDSTYRAHIEPDALTFATAVTTELLRPGLLETFGPDALPAIRRITVGVNPSKLVVRPNRAQDAKDAFEANAISWEALRRYLNFPDSDAPSSEELLLRLTLERSIGAATLTGPMLEATGLFPQAIAGMARVAEETAVEAGGEEDPAPAESDQPIPDEDQPEPADPAAAAVGEQLSLPVGGHPPRRRATGARTRAAAVQATPMVSRDRTAQAAGLGDRLAAVDRALADRLVTASSDALTNALRKIGNRLRSSAQGNPEMLEAIDGVDAPEVGAALLAAGFALPDILGMVDESDWFDQLSGRFDAWTAGAFTETTGVVAAVSDEDDRPEVEETVTAEADTRTSAGWALLYAALRGQAAQLTAEPHPTPAQGERDGLSIVPAGTVRDALAVVGGTTNPGTQPTGLAGEITSASSTGGVATGPQTARALRIAGFSVSGWTWHTGAPMEPFAPHHQLSGTEFSSWEDDTLINGSGWPPFSHYFPGDHVGCQCSATPTLVPITEG